jgi:hypothetical protein
MRIISVKTKQYIVIHSFIDTSQALARMKNQSGAVHAGFRREQFPT